MKIGLLSDLHLEFPDAVDSLELKLLYANVLVLAGDIFAKKPKEALGVLMAYAHCYTNVIAVAGNHEFYGTRLDYAPIRKIYEDLGIHFLQNSSVLIDGVRFHGATLWSDFDRGNPLSKHAAMVGMNDYRKIRFGPKYRKLHPNDTESEFYRSKNYFIKNVEKGDVVITHHLPLYQCIEEKYKKSPINGAFASNLSDVILGNKPSLWMHGHTHSPVDFDFGSTRVVCNPRGYYGHEDTGNYGMKIIEVDAKSS